MNRRQFLQLSVAALSALGLAGCSKSAPLRTGIHPWIGYEPLYLAEEFGWLPDSVRLVKHSAASDSMAGLLAGLWASLAVAKGAVTLGILSYRPEPMIQERYSLLAEYLSQETGLEVRLRVFNQDDLNRALASNRVDFFLTNPSHFLVIRSERSLTGVLATLQREWQGRSTGSIGGLILTRIERSDIDRLADLRGKSIATPGIHYLGGFQAAALELREAGVDILRHNRMVHLGNHDRVIRAVLTGDTDVGFVRTGVYEELTRENPALADELKMIHVQSLAGFPFAVLFVMLVVTSLWLSRKKRQLATEERRQRELIGSWLQPMLMIRNGELINCNRAAVDLVGYTSEASLLGKGLPTFSPHAQPDGTPSLQKADALIRRVATGEVAQSEWLFVRSDGSDVWVDMTLAPVYEHDQESPSILCSWYDITRRKYAEERQRLAL